MDRISYSQRDKKITNIKTWLKEIEEGWKFSFIHK